MKTFKIIFIGIGSILVYPLYAICMILVSIAQLAEILTLQYVDSIFTFTKKELANKDTKQVNKPEDYMSKDVNNNDKQ